MSQDRTPDQDRIHKAAFDLFNAMAYVPDSTIDYRVENARRLTLVLMRSAQEIVTEDVKFEREARRASKVTIEEARRAYDLAHYAYCDAIIDPNATIEDAQVAQEALLNARIALNKAEGKS